jgi:membrane-associated phospholipid phosphatase
MEHLPHVFIDLDLFVICRSSYNRPSGHASLVDTALHLLSLNHLRGGGPILALLIAAVAGLSIEVKSPVRTIQIWILAEALLAAGSVVLLDLHWLLQVLKQTAVSYLF